MLARASSAFVGGGEGPSDRLDPKFDGWQSTVRLVEAETVTP